VWRFICSGQAEIRRPSARRVCNSREHGGPQMQDSKLCDGIRDGHLLGPGRDHQHLPQHGHRRQVRRAQQRRPLHQQRRPRGRLQKLRLSHGAPPHRLVPDKTPSRAN
jgi:hypothetical protein